MHLTKSYFPANTHDQVTHYAPYRSSDCIKQCSICDKMLLLVVFLAPKYFSKAHLFTHANFGVATQSFIPLTPTPFSASLQSTTGIFFTVLHNIVSTHPSHYSHENSTHQGHQWYLLSQIYC